MKKRGSLFKYLLTFLFVIGITFLFNTSKVYAGTNHEITFKVYNCYSLNESALQDEVNTETNRVTTPAHYECLGPTGNGNTPLMSTTNITGVGNVYKLEPGQVIKVAFHYKPGSVPTIGVGTKYWYPGTSLDIVKLSKYNRSERTYSPQFGYDLGADFAEWYPTYSTTTGLSTLDDYKVTLSTYNTKGSVGDPIEDEMDIVYYYFKVRDDATTNTKLDFTWDTAPSGISIGNSEPYSSTNMSVYVEVPLSTDNTLGTLSVTNGSTTYPFTQTFTPGTETPNTYTAYVPNNITSINLNATPHDTKATLTGDGNKTNLQVGNNSYTITVLSESGEPRDYTVKVYRLSNDATLSALSLSGISFGTFSPNTTTYNATESVPYTTSSTSVSATATAGSKATVSGTGSKNLAVGANAVEVNVQAENCKSTYSSVPGNSCTSKKYTVNVTREAASTVSTLDDLLVDGSRAKGFTPGDGTSTYNLDPVASTKENIIIGYVKGQDNQTVTGDGTKTLAVGDNTFPVVVTAQDGTTKTTYTLKIHKKSGDNTLKTLSVTSDPAGTLTPSFASNKTDYHYDVDADENEVNIAATANHSLATVKIYNSSNQEITNGKVNPRTSPTVTVKVTPEDTAVGVKTYTITFDIAKSKNNNLSDLKVDGTTVSGFSPNTTLYELTVSSDKESTTIAATLADDRATLSGDTGLQVLAYGENVFDIVVTPEDTSTQPKTYTVKITRTKKDISTLSDLKVDGTTVPGFSPNTLTYTLDAVASTKANVVIGYTTTDTDATVTGDGTKTLSVGDNALKVIVTAQNGTDKTTYTINIHKKSGDNTLKSLSVTSDPAGTLTPSFASNKTDYHYDVDADENEVNIAATANHSLATVKIYNSSNQEITNGKVNPRTSPTVTVKVTPEDTAVGVKTYTITFDIAKSSNANLSSITVDGTEVSGFSPDTLTYNLTVDTTKESIDLDAILADDRASIPAGTIGTKVLDFGNNSFPIVVTAEDGTTSKTYTVNVNRPKRSDANLTSLKVDGTSVPNFDPDTLVYNLPDVANEKTKVNITYTLSDPDGATITGTGDQNLAVGNNALKVVVTAHNGTTKKTYTINIKRKSNDDTLKSLSVTSDPAGTIEPALSPFDPAITTYTYTADPDETEVVIAAEANHLGATVTGTGTYNPQTTKKVEVKVTSENGGEPKVYTINLALAPSSNANLSGLSVTGYTIEPDFSSGETEYTLTVPTDVSSIDVVATLADDRATVSGDGTRTLDYGDNEIEVTVTAEDGTTEKTYTITVTRTKKSDATLSDLTVDGDTVPGFSSDKYEYTLDAVANDKTSIIIGYTTTDEDATVSGDGTKNLAVGDNSFDVEVTAQNGTTTKTYKINIRRKNDDNTLKSLSITSDPAGTLDKDFAPGETNYTYTVDREETEVVIAAEANGEGASVSGTGTYNPQTDTKAEISVTSENGSTNVYTITFVKAKRDNANLESLEVDGYDFDQDFDPDRIEYTLTVPSDVDEIDIIAVAEDDGYANIEGDGNDKALTYGVNTFEITVTAEDGTTEKTYTITVTRELSDDVKLSGITIDDEPIDGFDPDVPTYTVDVDKDTTSVNIEATPADDNATVEVDGPDELQTGENVYTITVTAQDGSTTGTYTVTVNKAADEDNTLSELEVEGYTLDPEFDPTSDEDEFTLTVPSDVDSVNIIAVPNSDKADVDGDGTVALNPGENVIEITVTAEDGTPKTYTITITREEDEDDEKITSVVYGHDIDDTYILTGNLNATGLNMKNELDNDNEKLTITTPATRDNEGNITAEGTAISDTDYIGTGYEVVLKVNGVEKDRKIIVIKGEIDGNTEITLLDAVMTCYHYIATTSEEPSSLPTVSGAKLKAADIDGNGEITLVDAVSIAYHYLDKVLIQYKTTYTRPAEGE